MRSMTNSTKLTKFMVGAAAMAASAGAAAADFYLKLGPVKSGQASTKTREAAARIGVGQPIKIQSYSWGATQPSTRPIKMGEGRIAAADYDGDGRADRAAPSLHDGTTDKYNGKPHILKAIARGSVTLAGNFPSCTVGAAYEDAVLQVKGARYRFEDVLITACGPAGGSVGTPAQALTYSYLKRKLD